MFIRYLTQYGEANFAMWHFYERELYASIMQLNEGETSWVCDSQVTLPKRVAQDIQHFLQDFRPKPVSFAAERSVEHLVKSSIF